MEIHEMKHAILNTLVSIGVSILLEIFNELKRNIIHILHLLSGTWYLAFGRSVNYPVGENYFPLEEKDFNTRGEIFIYVYALFTNQHERHSVPVFSTNDIDYDVNASIIL